MQGISICIPVYNRDIRPLAESMSRMAMQLTCPYEINIADDCSKTNKEENRSYLTTLPHCKYTELEQNIGRSKIRNLLGKTAQYDNLIFMDCDMQAPDEQYLQRYVEMTDYPIVVGGATFQKECPEKKFRLRWKYGMEVEYKSASIRNQHPNKSFMTLNFMIKREVLLKYPFEETFSKYGHEDTVMGWTLEQNGITIKHIENPMIHLGIDDTESFLQKSREAVENVFDLKQNASTPKALIDSINLLRFYQKIDKVHLTPLVKTASKWTKSLTLHNLRSDNPNIKLLQWYKLGYLLELMESKQS